MTHSIWMYLLVMSAVTLAIRILPLTLIRRQIKSRFVRSFLFYVPYACLAAMTFPAILSSTDYLISAIVGFAVAILLAYLEKSMIIVAVAACAAVFVCEQIIRWIA